MSDVRAIVEFNYILRIKIYENDSNENITYYSITIVHDFIEYSLIPRKITRMNIDESKGDTHTTHT